MRAPPSTATIPYSTKSLASSRAHRRAGSARRAVCSRRGTLPRKAGCSSGCRQSAATRASLESAPRMGSISQVSAGRRAPSGLQAEAIYCQKWRPGRSTAKSPKKRGLWCCRSARDGAMLAPPFRADSPGRREACHPIHGRPALATIRRACVTARTRALLPTPGPRRAALVLIAGHTRHASAEQADGVGLHARWLAAHRSEPERRLGAARGLPAGDSTRVREARTDHGGDAPRRRARAAPDGRAGPRRGRRRADGHPGQHGHLSYKLDPMAIGRASQTKINANMGASPVSSGTDEEVEKLKWAERWGADTVMDLSTGGDLDACRDAIIQQQHRPDRHRADLLDDHRAEDRRPDARRSSSRRSSTRRSRASTTSRSTPACCASTCRSSRSG